MDEIKKYEETRYHIEVEHEPGTFDDDMDFLCNDPKTTYNYLQYIRKKYPNQKITITKIIEMKIYEPLSESDLEKLANEPSKH